MKEFIQSEAKTETAVLVALITKTQDERKTDEYLDELEFLAETAGAVTVKRFTQRLDGPSSVTYVGKGKLEEIRAYIEAEEEAERDRAGAESENPRPHVAHPRHLCHARTDGQRQNPSRTGPIPLYAAPTATPLDPP